MALWLGCRTCKHKVVGSCPATTTVCRHMGGGHVTHAPQGVEVSAVMKLVEGGSNNVQFLRAALIHD